jgi:gliding motility-associated-like protein
MLTKIKIQFFNNYKFIILLCLKALLLLTIFKAHATHNRAGEIIYKRIGGFTYQITVITYTKESATSADRCFLEINYGDGSLTDTIFRTNGNPCPGGMAACAHCGESIGNDVKKNIYIATHTYPGAGNYTISVEDPNRNAGVVNIPGSVDIVFYIETKLNINPFLGANNSPLLLNPPIDDACLCKPYIHNPGAYDPDGDSLAYKLVPCKGENGNNIGGYYIPPGASIDPITGDFIWPCPGSSTGTGEYNIAILIEEWKRVGSKTVLVGTVLRDMQITVKTCANNPPKIESLNDTCVIAGNTLIINVKATDPDNDKIKLTSSGYPYLISNPAYFDTVVANSPVTGQFSWNTTCNHIKQDNYTVFFKATDINSYPLVDLKSVNIKVIGPKTLNLTANPLGTSIILNWSANACSNAVGYKIYRRNGANPYTPDVCETGIPPYRGYTFIAQVSGYNTTTYTDNNNGLGLTAGIDYCYRVFAIFPDGSEGVVSDEVCSSLVRDVPIITNASVISTNNVNGAVYVAWSKPKPFPTIGLDTLQNAGPYSFKLLHQTQGNWTPIASFTSNYFANLNDTQFTHTNINTLTDINRYKVEFYSNAGNTFIGSTQTAPTIYLTLIPNDNKLTLSWTDNQPWTNSKYRIYKKIGNSFVLIDSTTFLTYDDINLVNGKEYCYYIEAIGEYSVSGITKPLINLSQEACEKPYDFTPPCAPSLYGLIGNCDNFTNKLVWNIPTFSCADDIIRYNIYHTFYTNGSYQLFATLYNRTDTLFFKDSLFKSIAGCYYVTALDSNLNESKPSDTLCVDNCPYYELPNVFTPNGDLTNDFFVPLPNWKFVESIDLKIYNRWGNLVFETNNPEIKWNGKTKDNLVCPDGIYYYLCTVNEIRLKGIVSKNLSGFVHIYQSSAQPAK